MRPEHNDFPLCATLSPEDMMGFEGRRRWKQERDLPLARFSATLPSAWRSAATELLLLLLLIPYGPGFLLLAEREGPSCGMQCCKRSKAGCCRNWARMGARTAQAGSPRRNAPEVADNCLRRLEPRRRVSSRLGSRSARSSPFRTCEFRSSRRVAPLRLASLCLNGRLPQSSLILAS